MIFNIKKKLNSYFKWLEDHINKDL